MRWNVVRRRFVALVCVLSLLAGAVAPDVSHAQDSSAGRITVVVEGEPVPFDGFLFDNDAHAKLRARLDSAEASCALEVEKAESTVRVDMQKKYDLLDAEFTTYKDTAQMMIESRDDTIDLQDETIKRLAEQPKRKDFALGVGVGAGGMVIVIIATAFALGAAN